MLSLLYALEREADIPGRAVALASHRPTLPKFPSHTPFQRQLQLAELEHIYGSRARAASDRYSARHGRAGSSRRTARNARGGL